MDLFSPFGTVRNVEVLFDPQTKLPRGYAFVHMDNVDQASLCIDKLNGYAAEGKALRVEFARRNKAYAPTPGQCKHDLWCVAAQRRLIAHVPGVLQTLDQHLRSYRALELGVMMIGGTTDAATMTTDVRNRSAMTTGARSQDVMTTDAKITGATSQGAMTIAVMSIAATSRRALVRCPRAMTIVVMTIVVMIVMVGTVVRLPLVTIVTVCVKRSV